MTVLGGAIANNLLNAFKTRPDGRPTIDWDLMVQLEPMTIAGALLGADLNDLLPYTILVVLLFLLLSITAYKTLQKAHRLHEKETQDIQKSHEALKLLNGANPDDEAATAAGDSSYGSVHSNSRALDEEEDLSPSVRIRHSQQVWKSASELSLLFVVVTVLNLLKGGPGEGGGPAGLEMCGDICFWMIELIILLIIVAFAASMRCSVLNRTRSGGPLLSDIEWNETNTIQYPMYAIVAGLVAGMFGVGGGIIKVSMYVHQ